MYHLNQKAQKVFDKITKDMTFDQSYKKIDNTNGAFMPLVVERLHGGDMGAEFSFCHYFEQNGDLCQDPEMVFLKHTSGKVYPMMFQQAIPPVYQKSMFYDGKWKFSPRIQREHKNFANMWLKNIKEQQGI